MTGLPWWIAGQTQVGAGPFEIARNSEGCSNDGLCIRRVSQANARLEVRDAIVLVIESVVIVEQVGLTGEQHRARIFLKVSLPVMHFIPRRMQLPAKPQIQR